MTLAPDRQTTDAATSTYKVVIFRQYIFILMLCLILAGIGAFVAYTSVDGSQERQQMQTQLSQIQTKLEERDPVFAEIINVYCVNGETVVVKTLNDETRIPMKCATGG